MKRILFLLGVIFLLSFAVRAQTVDSLWNGYLSPFVQTGGTAPNFTVQGQFVSNGGFSGSQIELSKKPRLIVYSSNKCYELPFSALSGTGSIIAGTVIDRSGQLSAIPSGSAIIYQPSSVKMVGPFPTGISASLQGCLQTYNNLKIDSLQAGAGITTGDKQDIDVVSTNVWVIDTGAVTTIKIAASAVDSSKIAANAVRSSDIGDSQVTMAKIARTAASTGQVIKWNGSAWAPAADGGGAAQPSNQVVIGDNSLGMLSDTSFKYFPSAKRLLIRGNNAKIDLLGARGNYAAANFGGAFYRTEYLDDSYADKIWIHKFDDRSHDTRDTGVYFTTLVSRSDDQNTIASSGADTTANRTYAWGWNVNADGSRQNTTFGAYSQNYEFYFYSGLKRLMEMNGTVYDNSGANFRWYLWGADHFANPTDGLKVYEERRLSSFELKGDNVAEKWYWNFKKGVNTTIVQDTGTINFQAPGPQYYYPIIQNGAGLIGNLANNSFHIGNGLLRITGTGGNTALETDPSNGMSLGSAAIPLPQGAAIFSNSNLVLALRRQSYLTQWELRYGSGNFRIVNTGQPNAPFLIDSLAPQNSFTVGPTGDIGMGTNGAPAKLTVVGNGKGLNVTGGTFANPGDVVGNFTGTATGGNWLYGINASLNVPGNQALINISNSSNSSASAGATLSITSTHTGSDVGVSYQAGGANQWFGGVDNSRADFGGDPFVIQRGGGLSTNNAESKFIVGASQFHYMNGVTSTGNTFNPGLTSTPEGSITGNPGDMAYATVSSIGRAYLKRTGTGNTGWEQTVTTSGTSTSIATMMREESFTATGGQTAFTISYTAPAVSGTSIPLRVYRNGVRLFYVASGPTITQFTFSGTTVTTAANAASDIITVEYLN